MLSQKEGGREEVGGGGDSKHVNGKINYQLRKFTPLGLMSWVTVLYFAPRGERKKRRGPMPLGLFLFSSFFGVTCPRLLAFAQPDKYLPRLSLYGLGLVSWVTLISFTPGGEGEQRRALMPLGLFFFVFFFGGHLPQTFAWSKQYLPVIFVPLEFIRQNFHDSWCRK